jgi:hypothetical protein
MFKGINPSIGATLADNYGHGIVRDVLAPERWPAQFKPARPA